MKAQTFTFTAAILVIVIATHNEAFATTAICPSDSGAKLIPNPEDCNKFFFCKEGTILGLYCDNNYHFDPVTQICIPPNLSNCVPTTTSPSYSYESETDKNQNVNVVILSEPLTVDANSNAPTTIRTLYNRYSVNCPANADPVLLPDDQNCSDFYFCQLGQTAHMTCPDGKHFSSKEQKCLAIQEAECELNLQTTQAPTDSDTLSIIINEETTPIITDAASSDATTVTIDTDAIISETEFSTITDTVNTIKSITERDLSTFDSTIEDDNNTSTETTTDLTTGIPTSTGKTNSANSIIIDFKKSLLICMFITFVFVL